MTPTHEQREFLDGLAVQFAVSNLVPKDQAWMCRAHSHYTETMLDGGTLRVTTVTDYEPVLRIVDLDPALPATASLAIPDTSPRTSKEHP